MNDKLEIVLPEGYEWKVDEDKIVIEKKLVTEPVKPPMLVLEETESYECLEDERRLSYHTLLNVDGSEVLFYIATANDGSTLWRSRVGSEITTLNKGSYYCSSSKYAEGEFTHLVANKVEGKFDYEILKSSSDSYVESSSLYLSDESDVCHLSGNIKYTKQPHRKEGDYYRRDWLRNGVDVCVGLRSKQGESVLDYEFWDTYQLAVHTRWNKDTGDLYHIALVSVLLVEETAHDGWTHYGDVVIIPFLSTNGVTWEMAHGYSLDKGLLDSGNGHMDMIGGINVVDDVVQTTWTHHTYGHSKFDLTNATHGSDIRVATTPLADWNTYWDWVAGKMGII